MEDQGSEESRASKAGARKRVRDGERAALIAAVLELAGEQGYRQVTVERLAARAGVSVGQFYSHFPQLEECFAVAYGEQAEALLGALLDAGGEPESWTEGLREALGALFAFATERRATARAILTQVYVVGGEAQARHEEALERLARAIDRARSVNEVPHPPPSGTAAFMVGAIEESVRWRLEQNRPEALWGELPELMRLVVSPYLGDEAGRAELRRPRPEPPRSR
jgi:AcrR family transcriptional regulator